MKEYFRKADIILLIVLVAIGLAATAVLGVAQGEAGADAEVVIKSGGELFAKYPLSEDRVIEVPAPEGSPEPAAGRGSSGGDECTQYDKYNIVEIKDGKVSVTAASCKNQVCVRHGAISAPGESIVCLPNRLVVSIEGSKGGGYDTITS